MDIIIKGALSPILTTLGIKILTPQIDMSPKSQLPYILYRKIFYIGL